MALGDPEKLAKAWATATSLHRYMVEKAQQIWRESTPGWPLPQTHAVASVQEHFLGQEFLKRLNSARVATIKELIAGRVVGLGRPSDAKGIEQINASFWIDAKVENWQSGTASFDGRTFSEVCVVPADALEPAQPGARPIANPSKPEIRREAIAACIKAEPSFLDDRTPSERMRAYRDYLSSRGCNPDSRGFGEKSFESDETAFRNQNNRMIPK